MKQEVDTMEIVNHTLESVDISVGTVSNYNSSSYLLVIHCKTVLPNKSLQT